MFKILKKFFNALFNKSTTLTKAPEDGASSADMSGAKVEPEVTEVIDIKETTEATEIQAVVDVTDDVATKTEPEAQITFDVIKLADKPTAKHKAKTAAKSKTVSKSKTANKSQDIPTKRVMSNDVLKLKRDSIPDAQLIDMANDLTISLEMAANDLGLSQTTLWRELKQRGITWNRRNMAGAKVPAPENEHSSDNTPKPSAKNLMRMALDPAISLSDIKSECELPTYEETIQHLQSVGVMNVIYTLPGTRQTFALDLFNYVKNPDAIILLMGHGLPAKDIIALTHFSNGKVYKDIKLYKSESPSGKMGILRNLQTTKRLKSCVSNIKRVAKDPHLSIGDVTSDMHLTVNQLLFLTLLSKTYWRYTVKRGKKATTNEISFNTLLSHTDLDKAIQALIDNRVSYDDILAFEGISIKDIKHYLKQDTPVSHSDVTVAKVPVPVKPKLAKLEAVEDFAHLYIGNSHTSYKIRIFDQSNILTRVAYTTKDLKDAMVSFRSRCDKDSDVTVQLLDLHNTPSARTIFEMTQKDYAKDPSLNNIKHQPWFLSNDKVYFIFSKDYVSKYDINQILTQTVNPIDITDLFDEN